MPSIFKFGFSTKVTKKKEEKIRERYEREALRKKQKLENLSSILMMMMILTLVDWVWGVIRCRMVTMYHCWRCLHMIIVSLDDFCEIISPPLLTIRKSYAGWRILLKTPMDTTRILAEIIYIVMRILG